MFDNPDKTLDELQQELWEIEQEDPAPRVTPKKTAKRKQADYEAILQQAAKEEPKKAPSSHGGLVIALILELMALALAVIWWKL